MYLLRHTELIFWTLVMLAAIHVHGSAAAPKEEISAKVALGLEMSIVPTPVTEALEAACDATALAQWFCDPEPCRVRPNFSVAAKPLVPFAKPATIATLKQGFDGPISTATAANFTAVLRAQLQIAADELAVRETLHRQYTAERNKDQHAAELQAGTLKAMVQRTMDDKAAANIAWKRLGAHLQEKGIDSKSTDPTPTITKIKEHGFPASEIALFKGLGLSPAEIDQTRKIVLENLDEAKIPKTFTAVIPGMIKINESNTTIQQCRCAPPQ